MSTRVYRLILAPSVEEEVADAAAWYETQVRGLGHQFLRAFKATAAGLGRSPLRYQPVIGDARRALLRRFPYAVFFELHGSDVVILACLHTARDPEEWRRRLARP